jgi:hypothetical protein
MKKYHFEFKKPFEYLVEAQESMLVPYIVYIVKEYFKLENGFELTDLRNKESIYHKYLCMYLIKVNTRSLTLSKIGSYFMKDHSAIIHAHKRISNFLFYDNIVRHDVEELQSKIDLRIDSIINDVEDLIGEQNKFNLDLDTFTAIKIKGCKKYLLGVNFTDEEIQTIKGIFNTDISKKYENTGVVINDNKLKRND